MDKEVVRVSLSCEGFRHSLILAHLLCKLKLAESWMIYQKRSHKKANRHAIRTEAMRLGNQVLSKFRTVLVVFARCRIICASDRMLGFL